MWRVVEDYDSDEVRQLVLRWKLGGSLFMYSKKSPLGEIRGYQELRPGLDWPELKHFVLKNYEHPIYASGVKPDVEANF